MKPTAPTATCEAGQAAADAQDPARRPDLRRVRRREPAGAQLLQSLRHLPQGRGGRQAPLVAAVDPASQAQGDGGRGPALEDQGRGTEVAPATNPFAKIFVKLRPIIAIVILLAGLVVGFTPNLREKVTGKIGDAKDSIESKLRPTYVPLHPINIQVTSELPDQPGST